ncbi:uncharacterized protein LOC113234584 [Hyposmocoma kahamanoa]|uniref:uncharacterized protein LOC113234584 n=1 Tax=Hyposmocoma kahamanoa TaxID=1477025 RepID=UPI000E6D88FB|nr:uncharacterized protein LOC113234584 [Hyposmocoma kahamanoa]
MTRGAITGTPFGFSENTSDGKQTVHSAYSDPSYCRRVSTTSLGKGIGRSKGHSDKDMRAYMQKRTAAREVHSEGETGGSLGAEALAAQMARFKRVSLRKLRAWRS